MATWAELVDVVAAVKSSAVAQPLSTTAEAKEQIRLSILAEELKLQIDNRNLRKIIAATVGVGLAIEILFLFLLVLAQGLGHIPFRCGHFGLEHWTFGVFTSAVLLQTFALATLIVRNLFPHADELRRAAKRP